jgi:molybdopterin-binding protein
VLASASVSRMVPIGDAARALGVSVDTLRRWEKTGRVATQRDAANRRVVEESEITRLGGHVPHRVDRTFSARNRFEGVVTSIEVTGVIAQVEIESGSNHIVSLITRDAVEELGLRPGVSVVATVKATSVMVARP